MGYLSTSVDDAILFAEMQVESPTQNWSNLCQSFCRQAYGVPAWASSAKEAWKKIPSAEKVKGGKPSDAPRGALIYFDSGTYGHVALAIGKTTNGNCYSNDYIEYGRIDKAPRDFPAWGLHYVGWSFWTPYGEMRPWVDPNLYWDGQYPSGEGSQLASDDPAVRNPQAWRWACRMADLGWYEGEPQPKGVQGWPRKAVERYQKARGFQVTGNYGPKLYKQIFGIEAP